MLRSFINNIPSYQFWLANLGFWLVLNTLAASFNYRITMHYERSSAFSDIWLEYIPWWGNWALITPLIIAVTATIKFDRQRLFSFVLNHLSIMIIVFTFYWLLTTIELTFMKNGYLTLDEILLSLNRIWLSPFHMDFMVYLAIIGTGYAITYYQSAQEQSLQNELLAKQLVQVELQSLKSQLNPHFLFNTLNTIAGLIRLERKSQAIKALSELSRMLRKVLENQNKQMISLRQEIDFIESYLTIQKMRFENKLDTQVTIEGDCGRYEIPFMLLQPLVENAVQHGSQLESNKNTLSMYIQCNNRQIIFKLTNKVSVTDEHTGFGIGLKNCRQRMEKTYKNNFSLSLKDLENGYFETILILPTGATNV